MARVIASIQAKKKGKGEEVGAFSIAGSSEGE